MESLNVLLALGFLALSVDLVVADRALTGVMSTLVTLPTSNATSMSAVLNPVCSHEILCTLGCNVYPGVLAK